MRRSDTGGLPLRRRTLPGMQGAITGLSPGRRLSLPGMQRAIAGLSTGFARHGWVAIETAE